MRRTRVMGVVLAVALAGCASDGGDGQPDTATSQDSAATNADTVGDGATASVAPGSLSVDDPAVRDAVLLSAIDEVLAETRFADLVDEDPGAFLETAETVCASLGDGATVDEVLSSFLSTLRDEGLELDEDTAYLGGAILGASVTVRCPEHEAEIAEVAP